MTNTKKIKYLIGTLGLLIIGSLIIFFTYQNKQPGYNLTSHADFQHYESLEDIVNNSEITILGKVISKEDRLLNLNIDDPTDPDGEYECTVYNIEIENVINGNFENETIEVKVIKEDEVENKFIHVGEEYVMFLDTFDTIPASLVNIEQATISIQDQDAIVNEDLLEGEVVQKNNISTNGKTVISKDDLINQLEKLNK